MRNANAFNPYRVCPAGATVALAGAAFSLACLALSVPTAESVSGPGGGGSVADVLFGSGREAIGDQFYIKADEFFHRGVTHSQKEAFAGRFFQKLGRQISPRDHVHLSGGGVKDIMPWMWLGIRMEPSNPELYLVAAYWLASELNRPDAAFELLREGQCNIPFCYPIQLEMGRMYIHMGRLSEARGAIRAALAFWPGNASPTDEEALRDRVKMLLYYAFMEEAEGDTRKAAAHFREIATIFPAHATLAERAMLLEAGGSPEPTARDALNRLAERAREHFCEEEEHEPGLLKQGT